MKVFGNKLINVRSSRISRSVEFPGPKCKFCGNTFSTRFNLKRHVKFNCERAKWFEKSKWKYFNTNIHNDITTLRKNLPKNVQLEIELNRTPDSFVLLTPNEVKDYVIEIEDL